MRKGPNGHGQSRKAILSEIDNSLRRLQTDYVDVYFMHRDNPDVPVGEFVDAMDAEVKAGWEREPHLRLRKFLTAEGLWSETEEAAWREECNRLSDIEVNAYLETKAQPVEAMFDFLYGDMPHDVAAQRAEALAWEKR